MKVYGSAIDADRLRALVGTTRQVIGWRQVVLGDWSERGVRAVEARTAGGFDISVLVDRALDIGDASIDGIPVAWRSPTGFTHPSFYEATPMGFQRSMGGGLFVTAGLDHVLVPFSEPEPAYAYPLIERIDYPMHGRISNTPGRLARLEENLDGVEPSLRVGGIAQQASVFGEFLQLDRDITTRIGEPHLKVVDQVTNHGGTSAPHMLLYHVNLGFPLLAPGARLFSSPRVDTWGVDSNDPSEIPFGEFGDPVAVRPEQVFSHRLQPDADGWSHAGVLNPHLGLAVVVSVRPEELPFLFEWRVERERFYALGLEPSTVDIGTREDARTQGFLQTLEPGQSRTYTTLYRGVRAASVDEACERLAIERHQLAGTSGEG